MCDYVIDVVAWVVEAVVGIVEDGVGEPVVVVCWSGEDGGDVDGSGGDEVQRCG